MCILDYRQVVTSHSFTGAEPLKVLVKNFRMFIQIFHRRITIQNIVLLAIALASAKTV